MAEGGQDLFCQLCHFRKDVEHHEYLCWLVDSLRDLAVGLERISFAELIRMAEETIILSQNRETDGFRNIYRKVRRSYKNLLEVRFKRPLTDAEQNRIPIVQITDEKLTATKCIICLDLFTKSDQVKLLPCGHFYHVHCIVKWNDISGTCPICRETLFEDFEIEDLRDLDTIIVAIISRSIIPIFHARVINSNAQDD